MKKFIVLGSILLVAVLVLSGCTTKNNANKKLNKEEAQSKTEQFINEFLMESGNKAKITEISDYGKDLYKVKVDIGNGQTVDSYVSVDGTEFFPQALSIGEITGTDSENTSAPVIGQVPNKSDKPLVELFVMSYCPFGTQVQKGMLPVMETLGDKMDFRLKFVSYAMHEKEEIDENLVQYCVQKEAPQKLAPYLKCFLAEAKGKECLASNNLNVSQCVKDADAEFQVSANYNNKSTWLGNFPPFNVDKADNEKYGVGGSPTLVINGTEVQSGRDSNSLLQTICSAFNNPPAECSTTLSSATPSSGFGFGTASSGSAADCVQ